MALTYVTINRNIEYNEELDTGWSFSNEAQEAYRTVYVAGSDVKKFQEDMIGWSGLGGAQIQRNLPEYHPRWPWLHAVAVDFVEPQGTPSFLGPEEILEFAHVKLRVTYRALPYKIADDTARPAGVAGESWRYVKKEETTIFDSVVVPGSTFVYQGTTDLIPEPPGVMVAGGNVVYTWHQVPCVDVEGTPALPGNLRLHIDSVVGRVNGTEFDGRYPPVTLLCLNPEFRFYRMCQGEWAVDITYQFGKRGTEDLTDDDVANPGHESDEPNWDRLLRASGKFRRVVRSNSVNDPNPRSIYDRESFHLLFTI